MRNFMKGYAGMYFLATALFSFSVSAENPSPSLTQTVNWPELASRFSVQVAWVGANVFEPKLIGGSGTGIIAEIRDGHGYVITNSHVVRSDPLLAKKLQILLTTDTRIPDKVPARVVGRSNLIDMAILEFDLKDLERSQNFIREAPFMEPGQQPMQLDELMSYGHPLGARNIVNTGTLAGFIDEAPWDNRPYLQMDVPINHGNSGGPLIDLRLGKVIGINSAGLPDANSTTYAIPIQEVLAEYKRWRENPEAYANDRVVIASFTSVPINYIIKEGLKPLIEQAIPNFFQQQDGIMIVNDAPQNTGLQTGDIVLSMNGDVIGSRIFELEKQIQRSTGDHVTIQIIRQKRIQEVNVRVTNRMEWKARASKDFVLFSGMVLRDISPFDRWFQTYGIPGVEVGYIVQTEPATRHNPVLPGALLTGIQEVDGTRHRIKSLQDLRSTLSKLDPSTNIVRVIVHQPFLISNGEVTMQIRSEETRKPMVKPRASIYGIPYDRMLTPEELSLEELRSELNLDGTDLLKGDWRNFVRKCQSSLAKISSAEPGSNTDI